MSKEIRAVCPIGSTCDAILLDGAGNVWNGSAWVDPEGIVTYGTILTALVESAVLKSVFFGTMPAGAAAACVDIVVKQRAVAGTPAITDAVVCVSVAPTPAVVAAAWGSRVLGNGRTADLYLQGFINRMEFSADGLTFTLYSTDDTTILATGPATRLGPTVGGLRGINPT